MSRKSSFRGYLTSAIQYPIHNKIHTHTHTQKQVVHKNYDGITLANLSSRKLQFQDHSNLFVVFLGVMLGQRTTTTGIMFIQNNQHPSRDQRH
jgi:hypothetical protein